MRSFFHLIVPCVVLQMGLMVCLRLLEGNLSAGRLIGLEKRAILQLFWASAQSVNGRPALGIPVSLCALMRRLDRCASLSVPLAFVGRISLPVGVGSPDCMACPGAESEFFLDRSGRILYDSQLRQ